jgi:phosphoglycerate dehydrogenase-like enzyme
MTDRVVVLAEALSPDEQEVFTRALPAGWRVELGHDALARATAVVVRDAELDASSLGSAPSLRLVVQIADGHGMVDAAAAAARRIEIATVESPVLASVAEHAVMAALALLKRLLDASALLRAGVVVGGIEPELTTQEQYAYNWVGLDRFDALYGRTVGLVGLGAIGTHAARLFNGFGCDVAYTKPSRLDPVLEREHRVRYLPFEELLSASDCVSLHLRFASETEQLIGDAEFGLMRRGALFVNTSRGRLVDEAALVRALESGRLGGAALDVFWREPLPRDNPLLAAPNLLLTPHTAGIPNAQSASASLRAAARRLAA